MVSLQSGICCRQEWMMITNSIMYMFLMLNRSSLLPMAKQSWSRADGCGWRGRKFGNSTHAWILSMSIAGIGSFYHDGSSLRLLIQGTQYLWKLKCHRPTCHTPKTSASCLVLGRKSIQATAYCRDLVMHCRHSSLNISSATNTGVPTLQFLSRHRHVHTEKEERMQEFAIPFQADHILQRSQSEGKHLWEEAFENMIDEAAASLVCTLYSYNIVECPSCKFPPRCSITVMATNEMQTIDVQCRYRVLVLYH